MLTLLSESPLAFLVIIIGLIAAFTLHEATHALAAVLLGDNTPKNDDRLSLNPLRHLDPLGFLSLLVFRFGWGKPVRINPNNFRHPVRDNILVALSGPFSNLLLAVLFAGIARLLPNQDAIGAVLEVLVYINILLAFFNLLPVPPLDGSKLLSLFICRESYYELERMGPVILLAVMFFVFTTSVPVLGSFTNFVSQVTGWLLGG